MKHLLFLLFLPVMLYVGLGCFGSMMSCVLVMPVGAMGMMRSLFVIASFMVLGGFLVLDTY